MAMDADFRGMFICRRYCAIVTSSAFASAISGISGVGKAFERGGEDGVGVGAAGRAIELGERQRRTQFETARSLSLRDGDGGQEGLLGRCGIGGVALQENFAARPMQFRFERAKAQAIRGRQRFVENGDGAIGVTRPAFSLSQRDPDEPVEHQDILLLEQLDAEAHGLETATVSLGHRPALEEHPECAGGVEGVLAGETSEFQGVRGGARTIAAHQLEQGRVHSSNRKRSDMSSGPRFA